jgi:CRISPR-associated protein Csx16
VTTFLVTRHPGALEWIKRQRIPFDRHETHLDIEAIQAGDTVIGSLPVNLAAEVCARGAIYRHLSLQLAAADRTARRIGRPRQTTVDCALQNRRQGRKSHEAKPRVIAISVIHGVSFLSRT